MKTKKVLGLILALCLTITFFTGCEKKQGLTNDGEVKEYTMFAFTNPMYSPDMPIWKEAEKLTGVRLIGTVPQNASNSGTAYNTMLASNELPDVIRQTVLNLRQLANDGGLIPLNDLIEEYAPNIQKFFKDCPEAEALATLDDGNIYFIPGSLRGIEAESYPTTGYYIRKDWLKKLNLKEPTNVKEYHDVLYAFATQDPNGNGMKDEVPYFHRGKGLTQLLILLGTAETTKFNEDETNIIYAPITEDYKNAVKELAKWYKEGIIDKELFTRSNAREQLLGQNLGGSTIDWFSSTAKYSDTFKDSVPGIDFSYIAPLEDVNGNKMAPQANGRLHSFGWGISVSTKEEDVINLIKYFDFWMSEKGAELISFGVEGVSYTYDNDKNVVWTDEALLYESGVPNYLRSIGCMEIGAVMKEEAEVNGMDDKAREGYLSYKNNLPKVIPTICYNNEEQEFIDKNANNISTAVKEQFQKWVMGVENVDATWDKYIKTLEKMNVYEYEKIIQSSYTRMYGKIN